MPLAHFTNLLTLNEEKYINERRKLILENIKRMYLVNQDYKLMLQ